MTTHVSPERLSSRWQVVDASGQRLGRLASQVAGLLMGKHKPEYSRHLLVGDHVVVLNAAKIEVTGKPSAMRNYYRHSGYIGHLKTTPMQETLAKRPNRVIERAVKGMLPGNRLGKRMLRRLKVYVGPAHPHEAQVNAGPPRPRVRRVVAPPPPVPEARAVPTPGPEVRTRRRAPAQATTRPQRRATQARPSARRGSSAKQGSEG